MRHFLIKITPNWIKRLIVELIRIYELRKFSGDKVFCPICESKFESFTFDRHKVRDNARCPKCDSLERHRFYWKYLMVHTVFSAANHKLKVLHVAPEKSYYKRFRKLENIYYYPGDLNPKNFSINMHQLDATNIQFEDNYFDVVMCNHVLEHIPDDRKAMSEMKRVLKDDGLGFIQVPIFLEIQRMKI